MMAQHILTRPVFEALFEGYDFAGGNPVARALDSLRGDFGEFGLENETRDLERFYESVRLRARGLDNSAARQRVLMELYERFFATALKKDADRLGIVYTPVEIVDFILASADRVLRDEFGRSLGDEGVHVLDPFTGTGIFLVRLLQSALIPDADLGRKYREELHANEIVLLAYYIAAIHIEEAFRGRLGGGDYEPFGGIVLTDTFNLHTERTGFPRQWLPDNSERAERQQGLPIQVVVGNPPWSAGQRSAADDNPNVDYPHMKSRIEETYAARSTAGEISRPWLTDSARTTLRACSTLDSAHTTLRACATSHLSHLIPLNPNPANPAWKLCFARAAAPASSCAAPARPYSARHAGILHRSRPWPRRARGRRHVRRRRFVGDRCALGGGRLRGRGHHAAALCVGRRAGVAGDLLRRSGHLRRPPGRRPPRHPPLRPRLRGALPRGGDRGFRRLLPARRDADPLRALQ